MHITHAGYTTHACTATDTTCTTCTKHIPHTFAQEGGRGQLVLELRGAADQRCRGAVRRGVLHTLENLVSEWVQVKGLIL